MADLFGTDGVRGVANEKLTPELALQLGRAGGYCLREQAENSDEAAVVMGRDTRISGDMLAGALTAGLNSIGIDVLDAGIIPSPAVAFLARSYSAAGGVMISASHNPAADNGIKFYDHRGYKISDALEEKIEEKMNLTLPVADHPGIGSRRRQIDMLQEYIKKLVKSVDSKVSSLKVVIDCAHGAAYEAGPLLFEKLGVDFTVLHAKNRGDLINVECGATNTSSLQQRVMEEGADLGIALDGDADRCILIDEKGEKIDGDHIMCICGVDMLRRNSLSQNRVAATRYSNLGLKEALNREGGELVLAPNGDKYVLEKMRKEDLNLGGEKSGHIIFLDYTTTGDGLLTALKVMSVMVRRERALSELGKLFSPWPQLMNNVKVERKEEWKENERIQEVIAEAREDMDEGRIFVRASGTEPVVRIMVEGREEEKLQHWLSHLSELIAEELN